MAKYSYEFKRKIVMEYLNGQDGCRYLGKKYGVPHSVISRWIQNYKNYGEESLLRSRQQQSYPFEFKLHVVELYLTSELSYQQLALQVGMTDPARITRWVLDYKEKIIREIEEGDSDEQKDLLKRLQEENLRLRIENAFLKESRRLRLEEEALLNEPRESSTASEENSN